MIIAITTDLHKSVPFTEKQQRKRETGIKDGFEAPFGTFRPGNQDCLFRWSIVPENFPLKGPEKFCSIVPSDQIFLETFANGKKPLRPVMLADDIY